MTTLPIPGSPAVRWRSIFDERVEQIEVPIMSAPNPSWRHLDAAGHWHCYDDELRTPSLEAVDGDEVDDDGEPLTHLVCRECGEEIRPGMTGPTARTIAGPTEIHLVIDALDGDDSVRYTARVAPTEIHEGWVAFLQRLHELGVFIDVMRRFSS